MTISGRWEKRKKTFPISSFGNELHIGNWISSSVSVEVYFMSNIRRVECPQSIGKAFGIPKGFLFLLPKGCCSQYEWRSSTFCWWENWKARIFCKNMHIAFLYLGLLYEIQDSKFGKNTLGWYKIKCSREKSRIMRLWTPIFVPKYIFLVSGMILQNKNRNKGRLASLKGWTNKNWIGSLQFYIIILQAGAWSWRVL